MVHKGWGGVFLPHLSKIRNNGPKSITIGSNAENHVRFHKTLVNFRKSVPHSNYRCARFASAIIYHKLSFEYIEK